MIGNAAKVPEKGEGQLTIKNEVKGVLFLKVLGGWGLRKKGFCSFHSKLCVLYCVVSLLF